MVLRDRNPIQANKQKILIHIYEKSGSRMSFRTVVYTGPNDVTSSLFPTSTLALPISCSVFSCGMCLSLAITSPASHPEFTHFTGKSTSLLTSINPTLGMDCPVWVIILCGKYEWSVSEYAVINRLAWTMWRDWG